GIGSAGIGYGEIRRRALRPGLRSGRLWNRGDQTYDAIRSYRGSIGISCRRGSARRTAGDGNRRRSARKKNRPARATASRPMTIRGKSILGTLREPGVAAISTIRVDCEAAQASTVGEHANRTRTPPAAAAVICNVDRALSIRGDGSCACDGPRMDDENAAACSAAAVDA